MSPSRSVLSILVILAISFIVGSAFWMVAVGGGDESVARNLLADLGALVVMNPDGRHVGTVSLSTLQDDSRLRDALKLTTEFRDVKALDLNGTAVDNAALKLVGNMSSLVSLSLKSTTIDNDGLVHLAKLTQLESLHLNSTDVSDAGISSLAALINLKVLDLSGTQVKNDLSQLSQLSNLEWLVLGELSLGESALDSLAELPKLKRLTLRGSTYAKPAVKQLQTKRPGLRVDE
jgi:hypothetical protein